MRTWLATEGQFVTGLFAEGGVDLQAPLRAGAADDALRELIASTWRARSNRYSQEWQGLLQIG